jgi:riboflavin biosynthesis pyrimidine reductase
MARLVPVNRVAANLVLASDGGTTINGSSIGLSFPADRQRFHQLRQEFDAILIGGNTARNEPYKKTPVPLIVLSHTELPLNIAANPLAQHWNLSIAEAIPRATRIYGDLLIEAGPRLVQEALSAGLVTELFLTISRSTSGENPVDIAELTRGALEISREESDEGVFLKYRI